MNNFISVVALACILSGSLVLSHYPLRRGQEVVASIVTDQALNLTVSAFNKTQAPLVEERKTVRIPAGYVYERHTVELIQAFPVEGSHQGDNWIEGPERTWSVATQAFKDAQQRVTGVSITVEAQPGRKNEEIGAEAILTVYIRKQS